MRTGKPNMGRKKNNDCVRRKIKIEKIENEEARQVCFSKRRKGLFNKASDLATLCGAELAVVVHSVAGNPYSFGRPGVHGVVDRFLSGGDAAAAEPGEEAEGPLQSHAVRQLNEECMKLSDQLQTVGARRAALEERVKALVERSEVCRFSENVKDLEAEQVEELRKSLEELRGKTAGRISDIRVSEGASTSSTSNPPAARGPDRVGVARARLRRNPGDLHIFL